MPLMMKIKKLLPLTAFQWHAEWDVDLISRLPNLSEAIKTQLSLCGWSGFWAGLYNCDLCWWYVQDKSIDRNVKPLLWQTNPFSPYLWEFQSSGRYRSLITYYIITVLSVWNMGETKKICHLLHKCWKKCCAEIDDAQLFLSMS